MQAAAGAEVLLSQAAASSAAGAGSAAEYLAGAAMAAGVAPAQASALAALTSGRPVCAMLDVDMSGLAQGGSSGGSSWAYDLGEASLFADATDGRFELLEMLAEGLAGVEVAGL
jgi:hypothetical protein